MTTLEQQIAKIGLWLMAGLIFLIIVFSVL
jgi:hypothetical protein